jgi:hypothetical protein
MGQATATDVWRTPQVSTPGPPSQASFGRTIAIRHSGHLPRMLSEDWTTQISRFFRTLMGLEIKFMRIIPPITAPPDVSSENSLHSFDLWPLSDP